MCTVSMIGDHYRDKFTPYFPVQPGQILPLPLPIAPVSRQEFDNLKADVANMKALLIRAKLYDERNGEPACEVEEKMDLLRKVAKMVGIDLDDVIGKPA